MATSKSRTWHLPQEKGEKVMYSTNKQVKLKKIFPITFTLHSILLPHFNHADNIPIGKINVKTRMLIIITNCKTNLSNSVNKHLWKRTSESSKKNLNYTIIPKPVYNKMKLLQLNIAFGGPNSSCWFCSTDWVRLTTKVSGSMAEMEKF